MKHRTLDLYPQAGEMLKPAELIDVSGAAALSLVARRIYNQLVANAFGSEMGEPGSEWSISLAELHGSHNNNEHVSKAIEALMRTIVTVRLRDGKTRRVALLGGNDMDAPGRLHGLLTYSFDPRLIPLLRDSTIFAKLEMKVIHAFRTKYGLALYEATARRVRIKNKFYEDFDIASFRDLIGVEPGKLDTWSNLRMRAIEPALQEVNGLAPFGVKVEPITIKRRVNGCRLYWWLKDVPQLQEANAELNRPRLGRMARLRGDMEQ